MIVNTGTVLYTLHDHCPLNERWLSLSTFVFLFLDASSFSSASVEECIPGQIALWDLEKNRLHVSLDDAHTDVVVSLAFLPGQPVFSQTGS